MKLTSIHAGLFKLDGGAMFGIIPKRLWTRLIKADENNLCTWSMRCLLIEYDDKKILVDTGMGDKQDEKFRSHFEPHGPYSLIKSLEETGVKAEEITDVFITHLHFDHVGGAVKYDNNKELVAAFPNAKYWMHKGQYEWSIDANPREKASFLRDNYMPLIDKNKVEFLDFQDTYQWYNGIELRVVNGHTRNMMYLSIPYKGTKIFYCADLMPSSYHIGMPYVMGYDIEPLKTLVEKEIMLTEAYENNYYLFYEHDAYFECSTIEKDKRGRLVCGTKKLLSEI